MKENQDLNKPASLPPNASDQTLEREAMAAAIKDLGDQFHVRQVRLTFVSGPWSALDETPAEEVQRWLTLEHTRGYRLDTISHYCDCGQIDTEKRYAYCLLIFEKVAQ